MIFGPGNGRSIFDGDGYSDGGAASRFTNGPVFRPSAVKPLMSRKRVTGT
jgi:hypothetical protein